MFDDDFYAYEFLTKVFDDDFHADKFLTEVFDDAFYADEFLTKVFDDDLQFHHKSHQMLAETGYAHHIQEP